MNPPLFVKEVHCRVTDRAASAVGAHRLLTTIARCPYPRQRCSLTGSTRPHTATETKNAHMADARCCRTNEAAHDSTHRITGLSLADMSR